MAAVAEGVAMGAAAATHQHRGGLLEVELEGNPTGAQMGAVASPAVPTSPTGAEVVLACSEIQRFGALSGRIGLWHRWSRHGRTKLTAWSMTWPTRNLTTADSPFPQAMLWPLLESTASKHARTA